MREIIFRGKRLNNGVWACGNLVEWKCWTGKDWVQHCAILNGSLCNREPLPGDFAEVDPATVGQFVGLKDRNGKEIYKGDIVEINSLKRDENILIVSWDSINAMYILRKKDGRHHDALCEHIVNIIGNIHENPELLGE